MRVAIIGSRNFSQLWRVEDFVCSLPEDAVVISGGAYGVDRAAASAARARNMEVVEYLPDYVLLGKRAPLARNKVIVCDADSVVAFWDGRSTGTMHAVRYAEEIGKPVTIVREVC